MLKFSRLPFLLPKLIHVSPLGNKGDPGMAAWSLSRLSWVGTRVFLVGTMMVRLVMSSLWGDFLLPLIGKSASILSTSMPSKISRPTSWSPRCRDCWWVLASTCWAALGPEYWVPSQGHGGQWRRAGHGGFLDCQWQKSSFS